MLYLVVWCVLMAVIRMIYQSLDIQMGALPVVFWCLVTSSIAKLLTNKNNNEKSKESINNTDIEIGNSDEFNMIYCRYCGCKIDNKSIFCKKCGRKL